MRWGDVVIVENATPSELGERLGHGRRKGVMEDRQVTEARGGIVKRAYVVREHRINTQGVHIRLMPEGAQCVANVQGMIPDCVAAMRGRDPLIDDHRPQPIVRAPGAGKA